MLWRIVIAVYAWTMMLFLAVPGLMVVPLSFSSVSFFVFPPPGWSLRWYEKFFTSPEWLSALTTSVVVGIAAASLSLVIGAAAAFAFARHRMPVKAVLNGFILSPLMMPVIIIAIGLYFWLVPLGLVGTRLGLVMGHTILGVPYVVVTLVGALQRYGPEMGRAAQSLGASPATAFRLVTFPILRPAFLAAAFLAFLASFDDLVIALFLATAEQRTLQVQMWRGIRFDTDPTIAAASTLIVVLTIAAFWAAYARQVRAIRRGAREKT